MTNLRIVTMAFEPDELERLCGKLGVDARDKNTAEINESIKIALGALANFVPLTNNERKSRRRKENAMAKLQAELEELEAIRTGKKQPKAPVAPRATAPRAAAPAPVVAEESELPEVEVEVAQGIPSVPPSENPFLSSDDDDEADSKESLYSEVYQYIRSVKASGNRQTLARANSALQRLNLTRENITNAKVENFYAAMGVQR